jgi:hypothetical protein
MAAVAAEQTAAMATVACIAAIATMAAVAAEQTAAMATAAEAAATIATVATAAAEVSGRRFSAAAHCQHENDAVHFRNLRKKGKPTHANMKESLQGLEPYLAPQRQISHPPQRAHLDCRNCRL